MKYVWFVTAALALALSACAQATPTIDPGLVQATAIAEASTMIALTHAAMPTVTPVPPTPLPSSTPLPSPTIQDLPTLDLLTSPTVVVAAGGTAGDPCAPGAPAKPLDAGAAGPTINILQIANLNKGPILFYAYLNKTSFGECGGRGATINGNQSVNWTGMPTGCYSFSAIGSGKTPAKAFFSTCIYDVQHKWTIRVYADRMTQVGP